MLIPENPRLQNDHAAHVYLAGSYRDGKAEVCSCVAWFEAEQYLLRDSERGHFRPLLTEVLMRGARWEAEQEANGDADLE